MWLTIEFLILAAIMAFTLLTCWFSDGSEKVTLRMSAKRIQSIRAFMNRGCPVLWIKPDAIWAQRARDICGMKSKRGPYLDPDSDGNNLFVNQISV